MARKNVSYVVLKSLLAKSGNKCAFPNCDHPIVNNDHLLISELAHIEAVSPNGPRFNSSLTEEQINSYNNLLYLCHQHHKEVDYCPEKYTVEILKNYKNDHELANRSEVFRFNYERFRKVNNDFFEFQERLNRVHNEEHIVTDLSAPIFTNVTFQELIVEMESVLYNLFLGTDQLRESDEKLTADFEVLFNKVRESGLGFVKIPYRENPFEGRNWEMHNLGFPNFKTRIKGLLLQMELLYFQEYLKTNNETENIIDRMNSLKLELEDYARNAGLAD